MFNISEGYISMSRIFCCVKLYFVSHVDFFFGRYLVAIPKNYPIAFLPATLHISV